jgi:hypothetical protein
VKKLVAAAVLAAGVAVATAQPALAGGSTDAALALGAFAVFNQIVRGETIFQQRPAVVHETVVVQPPPAPAYVPAPPPPAAYAPAAPPAVVYAPAPPPAVVYAPAPPPAVIYAPPTVVAHGHWAFWRGRYVWVPAGPHVRYR